MVLKVSKQKSMVLLSLRIEKPGFLSLRIEKPMFFKVEAAHRGPPGSGRLRLYKGRHYSPAIHFKVSAEADDVGPRDVPPDVCEPPSIVESGAL